MIVVKFPCSGHSGLLDKLVVNYDYMGTFRPIPSFVIVEEQMLLLVLTFKLYGLFLFQLLFSIQVMGPASADPHIEQLICYYYGVETRLSKIVTALPSSEVGCDF